MEIKLSENSCIITPLSSKLDERQVRRLFEEIKLYGIKNVGINLDFVQDCTIDFLNALNGIANIGLFNINSDIFALFSLMNIDKKVNLFVSEEDFLENSHRLMSRKFTVV